jgi:hypothetical protein
MPSNATSVPDETAMLCEACGYVLNGLPEDSRCPECGQPIADSSPALRRPPAWERQDDPSTPFARFFATTSAILFHPSRFYRTLNTRSPCPDAQSFAFIHWAIASVLFATAGYAHADWYASLGSAHHTPWQVWPAELVLCFLCLWGLTNLAATLTTWEATYRGLRLPRSAVLRAMHYHAAHYLPVSLLAALTVVGYRALVHTGVLSEATSQIYLYVVCIEVVLAAFFLFNTYWIGMRKMMFANA